MESSEVFISIFELPIQIKSEAFISNYILNNNITTNIFTNTLTIKNPTFAYVRKLSV